MPNLSVLKTAKRWRLVLIIRVPHILSPYSEALGSAFKLTGPGNGIGVFAVAGVIYLRYRSALVPGATADCSRLKAKWQTVNSPSSYGKFTRRTAHKLSQIFINTMVIQLH